jgi:pyruvate/2-oxoglutarate dehydrogenase complex dihydrolipoamide acyltransferase (E2) component
MGQIIVPQLGETPVEEMTITRWLKGVGEIVKAGEPLFEVETGKAVIEVEASESGVLAAIQQPTGAIVQAGDVAGVIDGMA